MCVCVEKKNPCDGPIEVFSVPTIVFGVANVQVVSLKFEKSSTCVTVFAPLFIFFPPKCNFAPEVILYVMVKIFFVCEMEPHKNLSI